MANYQRSISYLDYLENGMKIRNAGFVKTEENNGQMRLEVRMKNLPEMFSGQYDLHADTGGVAGTISLNRGSGSCCIVWNKAETDNEQGVEAGGIYLRLPGRRLVQTVWPTSIRMPLRQPKQEAERLMPEVETVSAAYQGAPTENQNIPIGNQYIPIENWEAPTENLEVPTENREASLRRPEQPLQSPEQSAQQEQSDIQLDVPMGLEEMPMMPEEIPTFMREPGGRQETEETLQQEHYYSDKWEQLSHMYPQIHPFGDERVYLSIAPKDFVVLCRDYQKMVHNSFLLHGFYNYHHLLLGKIEEKGEWHYYLGVPGNFYTREKMVAEMFGFEAFEGEKNPASPGDFGYYMKRVEI